MTVPRGGRAMVWVVEVIVGPPWGLRLIKGHRGAPGSGPLHPY